MSNPSDLTPRVAQAESNIVALQTDTADLQNSDKDIANRLSTLENTGDLSARVTKIEYDIVALNATISELKTARDDALTRLAKLEVNKTNIPTIYNNVAVSSDAPVHSFQDENVSTDAPVHHF